MLGLWVTVLFSFMSTALQTMYNVINVKLIVEAELIDLFVNFDYHRLKNQLH